MSNFPPQNHVRNMLPGMSNDGSENSMNAFFSCELQILDLKKQCDSFWLSNFSNHVKRTCSEPYREEQKPDRKRKPTQMYLEPAFVLRDGGKVLLLLDKAMDRPCEACFSLHKVSNSSFEVLLLLFWFAKKLAMEFISPDVIFLQLPKS